MVNCGNPCGPCCCCGCKKQTPLPTACLLIGMFEIYLGCIVVAASLGTFTGRDVYYVNIYGSFYWDFMDTQWLLYAYGWQAICYFVFALLGGTLLLAYLKRQRGWCMVWIVGAVLVQLISMTGIYFSWEHDNSYTVFVGVMTLLRMYFIWVMLAFHHEILNSPDPNLGNVAGKKQVTSEVQTTESLQEVDPVTAKSSIKYVGDG